MPAEMTRSLEPGDILTDIRDWVNTNTELTEEQRRFWRSIIGSLAVGCAVRAGIEETTLSAVYRHPTAGFISLSQAHRTDMEAYPEKSWTAIRVVGINTSERTVARFGLHLPKYGDIEQLNNWITRDPGAAKVRGSRYDGILKRVMNGEVRYLDIAGNTDIRPEDEAEQKGRIIELVGVEGAKPHAGLTTNFGDYIEIDMAL